MVHFKTLVQQLLQFVLAATLQQHVPVGPGGLGDLVGLLVAVALAVRDGAAAAFPLVGDFGALGERQDGPVSLGTMYATSLRAAKSTLSSDSSDFAPMLIPRRLRSAMTFLLVVFLVNLSRKLLSRYKTVRTSRIFPVPVLPCRLRRFRQPSPMPE